MEKTKSSNILLKEKKIRTYRRHQHSVMEKCQAILSVWSERRSPSQVCREMSITWTLLSQWQNRALEGMMQALEPRVNLETAAALNPRLHALLEKKEQQIRKKQAKAISRKLDERLDQITQAEASSPEKGA